MKQSLHQVRKKGRILIGESFQCPQRYAWSFYDSKQCQEFKLNLHICSWYRGSDLQGESTIKVYERDTSHTVKAKNIIDAKQL